MAKFKVYELAKELNKSSKEVVAFLQEKGIEVKAAQSSVDDAAAELVKKHFGGQSEVKTVEEPKTENVKTEEIQKADGVKKEASTTEKTTAEEGKAEEQPKKKKNIIFVSNPQNSKMPGGQKNAVKNNNQRTNNKPNNSIWFPGASGLFSVFLKDNAKREERQSRLVMK